MVPVPDVKLYTLYPVRVGVEYATVPVVPESAGYVSGYAIITIPLPPAPPALIEAPLDAPFPPDPVFTAADDPAASPARVPPLPPTAYVTAEA